MAQVDDLLVLGNLQVTGSFLGNFPSGTIVIPASGWVNNPGGTAENLNLYKISITIPKVLATSTVDISIDINSQSIAGDCGMSPVSTEYFGGIILYSKTIPSSDINAKYTIVNGGKAMEQADVTLTKADLGLDQVTNESKATMFTNPALTGIPTAPTAAVGTNTTQIATTAFVNSEILNDAPRRINLAGQLQLTSYRRSVIAICDLTNTNPSANSYTNGVFLLHRTNGLSGSVQYNVVAEKRYNTTVMNFSGLQLGAKGSAIIRPCTFTYNGVKYGGIEIWLSEAEYSQIEFQGTTNFGIFGLDYYNTQTSSAINTEINSSINFSENTIIDYIAFNGNDLARLGSPALTGTPTAPTPTAGNNTTQIATTAFVATAIASSPVLGGTPTAATAALDTNSTQIATTAFVKAQILGDAERYQRINTVKNNLGDPFVREMALFHGQFSNKFRFVPASFQEDSTDGVTWNTSTKLTLTQLKKLMIGEGQVYDASIIATTVGGKGYYRLTWDIAGTGTGYVFLNHFYAYLSTNGNTLNCKIEAYHNTNGWTELCNGNVNNWPGHVSIPHTSIPFSSSASQYGKIRITFSVASGANTNGITLSSIEWFGGYPAGRRNVESYDENKNVTFPANLTANRVIAAVADYNNDGLFSKTDKFKLDFIEDRATYIPFVVGTQAANTSAWTGELDTIPALYDGLTIRYWLPRTSTSTSVTLDLTLADGASSGQIACYWAGTTRITTHYPAGTIILLTYVVNKDINGTNYTGWWAQSDYVDGNESYTVRWSSIHKVGAAIYAYKLCMFAGDGKLYPLTLETGTGSTKTVSTVEFELFSPILYYGSSATLAAEATTQYYLYEGATYNGLHYTANQSSGFTAYKPIFLKGTVNANGKFVLDNTTYTSWLTQTLPTTEDGFIYILLGYMYDTTYSMRLATVHPILQFKNGAVVPYSPTQSGGDVSEDVKILQKNFLDLLMLRELDAKSTDADAGYWWDTLMTSSKITSMSGLTRNQSAGNYGELSFNSGITSGTVSFNPHPIGFISNKVRFTMERKPSAMTPILAAASAGQKNLTVKKYSITMTEV